MRFLRPALLALSLFSSARAQDADESSVKQRHGYQSDVARIRNIVINSLYSHREVFLRELISNANDALEKLRMTALTNRALWDGGEELNVTIRAYPGVDDAPGRLVITDNGIGMTKEELTANLGTLAKSGTTEFLAKSDASGDADGTGNGNLIGAFGVGFYSAFLVADRVLVASVPATGGEQFVFASTAAESEFDVYADPRGKTLNRGTEITLVLKPDAAEYLDSVLIAQLISKHSTFSTSFPIYLWETKEEQVPVEEEAATAEDGAEKPEAEERDEDEAVIEDEEEEEVEPKEPEMKTITVERWAHANPAAPLWTNENKNITDMEYELFYQATFKDFQEKPLAWHHFSGDVGAGVSFKALLYIPGHLPESFWSSPMQDTLREIKLMVKRVFITSDMGENYLPKWASWLKAVVDADDLPLNVSRETLQNTSFLRQIKSALLRRIIQTFTKVAEEDPEGRFKRISKVYGNVFKLGAVEDEKNRDKLAALVRFNTNQRDFVSLDQYIENKKEGQKQLYYHADLGKPKESLMGSVFVEKLQARGYEVLLLTDPIDELFVQNIRKWQGIPFQDVAKQGLKFGDEKLKAEDEKAQMKAWKEKFEPLTKWLKTQADDVVRQVIVSDRLVTSPCAIFADASGVTANMQRMMQGGRKQLDKDDPMRAMQEYYLRQKTLEINPRSPLIEGLLRRVVQLWEDANADEEVRAAEEAELKEVAAVLLDGALVRSGFEVTDSNLFMSRVDRVLRRSLGVDQNAPTEAHVEPAPPVNPEVLDESEYEPEPEEDDGKAKVVVPEHMKEKVAFEMDEISDEEYDAMMQAAPAEERVTVDEVLAEESVELPVEAVVEEHEAQKVLHEEL